MAAKMDSRSGTRPTKVTFNRASNNPVAPNATQNNETSHEMHIKMSKKIAQLTKVIYSLNTKNDEHEEIIEGLKTAHQEELQKVMVECRDKMGHYRQKMELIDEQELLISKLQSLLEEERTEKQNFITDFEKFKQSKDEMEKTVVSKYETKMAEMANSLVKIKDEFENRTQQFEIARRKFESEKEETISDLTHQQSLEMEKLIKAHRVRYDELQNEKGKLQQEVEQMRLDNKSKLGNRDTEIKKLMEDHDAKCEKLKSFYENELAAARQKHEAEFEDKIEKMKNDAKVLQMSTARTEESLRNRIKTLHENNENLETEIEKLKEAAKAANEELSMTLNNNDNYSAEVSHLKQELSVTEVRFKNLQNELDELKNRFGVQTEELLRKAAELGSLEALKISNSNTIKELTSEVDRLHSRCHDLEAERSNLGRKLSASSSEATVQLKTLQRELERIQEEKKRAAAKYEQLLTESKVKFDESKKLILSEKATEIAELTQKHDAALNFLKGNHKDELEENLLSIKSKHAEEIQQIENRNRGVIDDHSKVVQRLKEIIENYEKEISDLKEQIKGQSLTQASTSDEVRSLSDKLKQTEDVLVKSKKMLALSESKAETLQNEINEKKAEFIRKLEESEQNSKRKLKDLADQLDKQWGKKLSDECENLRHALQIQQKAEKDTALNQLLDVKDKEIEAYKNELHHQVQYYQDQISQLRKDLQNAKNENDEILRKKLEEINQQQIKYEEIISRLKFDHSGEVEDLYLENEQRLKALSEQHSLQLKKTEEKLSSEHQEALSALMMANRAALDGLKRDLEKTKNKEIESIKVVHSEEKDRLRQTLHAQHQHELEQQNLQFEEEFDYIKDDLKKTKDMRTKEFAIHTAKIEELTSLLSDKEKEVEALEEEFAKFQENISTLNHELESKVEEIRKVRREGNLNMRRREQHLAKEHQSEVDSLTADHLRETQKLLAEFNRAKELLKDKIDALQLMLEKAEERYRNRESRPEDLDTIEQLKVMVTDRELECQKHVEEKRYFQLELLNRETNFNKIFNNMPNVGVINPLQSGKKKRKAAKDQWSLTGSRTGHGSPNGTTSPARLDPLPHPQIHEQRLNNSKPLPRAPVQGT